MTRTKYVYAATSILALGLLIALAGCTKKASTTSFDGAISEISYHFGDASVPPEHHRSFTITVTPSQTKKVTDSYGDIIEDKTQAITEAQFQALVESLRSNKIGKSGKSGADDSNGCTGGTTESIKVTTDKGELLEGSVYHCGSKDFGNLSGNVEKFVADVKALWE